MKAERSFTSDELVGRGSNPLPGWREQAATVSGRKSRLASASTNKVKAGLKKLEKLGIR